MRVLRASMISPWTWKTTPYTEFMNEWIAFGIVVAICGALATLARLMGAEDRDTTETTDDERQPDDSEPR